ncbi:single-stranded DNA-binding protein [Candidatus Peregrinibacteria bacterium CG08_land_8_20_14_0_20_41_10]|nr:MAG: hypothetical protein AUJ78_01250 [Candidatus Peregrinibacteria bacterium CG1_02_41_10]PIS32117.1 MAG: single-stranded DNA-binding protein [Candidatus Peregrinibacteria bacterium CG08_land_8_20_14_0_20_41_10]
MRSVNKVILIGNLTRDPEVKETASGQKLCTFTIATNREWMSKTSERKSLAEFHNVAAWGRLSDICARYLKKSKLVYVEGYLKTRSWQDEVSGKKVFRTEIVIYDMIMLEKRPKEEGVEGVEGAEEEEYATPLSELEREALEGETEGDTKDEETSKDKSKTVKVVEEESKDEDLF